MFKLPVFALVIAVLAASSSLQAATPVYKCVIKGSVVYQSSACPTGETRPPPTVEQLNAERKKRLEQAGDGAAKTPPTEAGVQRPQKADADSTPLVPSGKERTPLAVTPKAPSALPFRCDGRRYCSQMKSCEEAKYFLANCPGVKMDGDRDGIPCEDQWCHN